MFENQKRCSACIRIAIARESTCFHSPDISTRTLEKLRRENASQSTCGNTELHSELCGRKLVYGSPCCLAPNTALSSRCDHTNGINMTPVSFRARFFGRERIKKGRADERGLANRVSLFNRAGIAEGRGTARHTGRYVAAAQRQHLEAVIAPRWTI